MEQRPLRLGDIVDDYCPRERRITNHAVVALIGDEIRQTRCTTCDGEHVYKQARMPRRVTVLKDGTTMVDPQSDNGQGQLVARGAAAKEDPAPPGTGEARDTTNAAPDAPASDGAGQENGDGASPDVDGWVSHRPLIRASLPRTEGEPPVPRPIPEFTMHRQAYGRPFRQGQGHGRQGNGQANGFGGNPGNYGNQGNHGNHGGNPGNQGNGQPRPPGSGRRRRRRGGRPKPPN